MAWWQFTVDGPHRENGTYRLTLNFFYATKKEKGDPIDGVEVEFKRGSVILATVSTIAGWAHHEELGLTPGKYTFVAHVKNTSDIASQQVTVGEPVRPRKVNRPQIRAEGDEGRYKVSLTTTYEDGGIPVGIPIRFLITHEGKPSAEVIDTALDQRGFALCELNFPEPSCTVVAHIAGHETEPVVVFGPSLHPRPPRIPEPPSQELGAMSGRQIRFAEGMVLALIGLFLLPLGGGLKIILGILLVSGIAWALGFWQALYNGWTRGDEYIRNLRQGGQS